MFKQHPKKAATLQAALLAVALITGVLWPIGGGGVAFAENISLTYSTDSYGGNSYSKYPTLSPNNIIAKAGYKIKSLTIVNYQSNDRKIVDAVAGKALYDLSSITLAGNELKVKSLENKTGKSYYAWYRYAKGTNGNMWNANFNRIDDSYNEYGDSRTSGSSQMDSYGMPKDPGTVDTNLTLAAVRAVAFKTDNGDWVDTPYITHDKLTGTATVDAQVTVEGPEDGISGKAKPTKISNYTVDAFPDLDRFIVRYTQAFDYVEDNFKPLAAYGAALMVYFSAFTVDLESVTYQYPYRVDVEWDPIVSPSPTPAPSGSPMGDDLSVESLTFAPDPFTVRDEVAFTYVLKNNSSRSWTNFYYNVNGIEKRFTDVLPPGKTYTGTYQTSISSPATVKVKVDSRELIPETDESNNEKSVFAAPSAIANNRPPEAKLQWFDHWTQKRVTSVVEGTVVDLKYVDVSDPEGDSVHFNTHFSDGSSGWIKGIPAQGHFDDSQDEFRSINTNGGAGSWNNVKGTVTDRFGASTDVSATLDIIPPNPVAVPSCPRYVKENRPVDPNNFNGNMSYSPIGREIDHSRDEWTNKWTSYTNGTPNEITAAISLNVWDKGSPALKSLSPGTCTITVRPDLPPVAKLGVPPLAIRNQNVDLFNNSTSPDGDPMVSAEYKYKYDAANNGFADDAWQSLSGNLTKAGFTPNRVGKYLFYLKITEDYGKWDDTSGDEEATLTMIVTNLAPEVSFEVKGENKQPVVNPPLTYTADQMLGWQLYQPSSLNKEIANFWTKNSSQKLSLGLGLTFEKPLDTWSQSYPGSSLSGIKGFANTGLGNNRMSSYRGAASFTKNDPVLIPYSRDAWGRQIRVVDQSTPYSELGVAEFTRNVWSNPKYVFFTQGDSKTYNEVNNPYLYALNPSKLPNVELRTFEQSQNSIRQGVYWTDGNPYDFVLSPLPPTLAESYYVPAYDSSGHTYSNMQTKEIIADVQFVMSDRYIYQVATIKHPKRMSYGYIGNDNYGYVPSDFDVHFKVYEYDAYSGQLRNNFQVNGFAYPSYSLSGNTEYIRTALPINFSNIGDDLVINLQPYANLSSYFRQYGKVNGMTIRVNADGQLIAQVVPRDTFTVEKVMSRNFNYNQYDPSLKEFECVPTAYMKPQYDGEGNSYQYYQNNCTRNDDGMTRFLSSYYNPESPAGMWLVKRDPMGNEVWKADLTGDEMIINNTFVPEDTMESGRYMLAMNPFDRTIETLTFTKIQTGLLIVTARFNEKVNMDTGQVVSSTFPLSVTSQVALNPLTKQWDTTAAKCYYSSEGKCNIGSSVSQTIAFTFNGYTSSSVITGDLAWTGGFGDGVAVNFYKSQQNGWDNGYLMYIAKGPPTTTPVIGGLVGRGQFVSPVTMDNTSLQFGLTLDHVEYDTDRMAGVSFRMQDPKNRYAVEANGSALYLSKYVNGSRFVMASSPYPFHNGTEVSFKLTSTGNHLDVSINGVPYLSADDGTYASGTFGPFSEKSYVSFSTVIMKSVPVQESSWMNGYAIWEEGSAKAEIKYENILFDDPEHDPMSGSFRWSYTHTPKFLNNQGVSALDGQVFATGQPTFDKVGVYDIALSAQDDPHPSYLYPSNVFGEYRKDSNRFTQRMVVHRRPIAQFTATVQADKTIGWTDGSYDPDRYDPVTGAYSAPDVTGLDYNANHGIVEREYSYLDQDGQYVKSKLVSPQKPGTYTLYLRVKDEYGAWSYPAEQTLVIAEPGPVLHPPTVSLIYPNGAAKESAILENSVRPVIRWNQWDADPGTIFQSYNVRIMDEYGAPAAGTGELAQWSSSTTASWPVNVDLVRGKRYQVQVQVGDGKQLSEWSNIGWMVINSKPNVTITNPNGTPNAPTLISSNKRPVINWSQSDPEWARFNKFYIEILREDGSMVWNTGWGTRQDTANTLNGYQIPVDLPTGEKLQARMMVTDQDDALWSDWSNTVWFKINYPPTAELTYPNGTKDNPTVTGMTPLMAWEQHDPDPNTVYSDYQLIIRSEDGSKVILDTGKVSQNNPEGTGTFQIEPGQLPQGSKLQAQVRVWDQDDAPSPWSAVRWMMTNRPPTADFDWTPKPVWEGDTVRIISTSQDPDGDELTYYWQIQGSDGSVYQGTAAEWSGVFPVPGEYRVTLTVSDGYETASVTKTIRAELLTIEADIRHTPEWQEHHEKLGHETVTPPKDFYSGEKLILELDSAPAPVEKAEAWLDETGMSGRSIWIETDLTADGANPVRFNGELYDEVLSSLTDRLPNGAHTVHFRLTYANGVVKQTDVPFNVIGSVHQAVQVHRVQ